MRKKNSSIILHTSLLNDDRVRTKQKILFEIKVRYIRKKMHMMIASFSLFEENLTSI